MKTYEYENFDLKNNINFQDFSYKIFDHFDKLWNQQTITINSKEKKSKKI